MLDPQGPGLGGNGVSSETEGDASAVGTLAVDGALVGAGSGGRVGACDGGIEQPINWASTNPSPNTSDPNRVAMIALPLPYVEGQRRISRPTSATPQSAHTTPGSGGQGIGSTTSDVTSRE